MGVWNAELRNNVLLRSQPATFTHKPKLLGPCFTRLRCHFPSHYRTANSSTNSAIATSSSEQMWPNWPLTSTRTAPKISLAASTWRRPYTASTPCPATCAALLPRRCSSEWEAEQRLWYFYALMLNLLCNVFFFFFLSSEPSISLVTKTNYLTS